MPTRLDAAYTAAVDEVRAKVLGYATRYWRGQASYRDEQVPILLAKLVPRIEAGQARIGQLTDAYISRLVATERSAPIKRGVVADTSTSALRNGVDAAVIYERPFVSLWSGLSAGKSFADSVEVGLLRLTAIADTDLQLARTHSADRALQRSDVQQYQRVPTSGRPCALCLIASTQRYHTGNLSPIHKGCHCLVKPYDGPDVQVINPRLLENVHEAVEAQFGTANRQGQDYRDLVVVHHNGEVGPVLSRAGDKFTGPRGLLNH